MIVHFFSTPPLDLLNFSNARGIVVFINNIHEYSYFKFRRQRYDSTVPTHIIKASVHVCQSGVGNGAS